MALNTVSIALLTTKERLSKDGSSHQGDVDRTASPNNEASCYICTHQDVRIRFRVCMEPLVTNLRRKQLPS